MSATNSTGRAYHFSLMTSLPFRALAIVGADSRGVLRKRYSHPPLRFSTGRILMNASTAWILPS